MSANPRLSKEDGLSSKAVVGMPVVLCFLKCTSNRYNIDRETVDELSQEFEGEVRFAVVDPFELAGAAEKFDVNSFPALVLIDGDGSNRGLYWGEFVKEEIREHLEKWIAGHRQQESEMSSANFSK